MRGDGITAVVSCLSILQASSVMPFKVQWKPRSVKKINWKEGDPK